MESAQDPWTMPALPPPLGMESNFVNPIDHGVIFITIGSISMALLITFFLLRLYAKVCVLRSFGWDDFACILATIGRVAVTGLIIYLTSNGVGKHMWNLRLLDLPLINKYSTLATKLEPPVYFFTKVSLLLLYFRLFSPDKTFKYLILAGIALCLVAYTTIQFCLLFLNDVLLLKVNVAMGAFNVLSDVYILCLPMMAVSRLRLPRGKKFGVMLIFLSGIFACIMSILALIYRARFNDNPGTDLTWELIPAYIVSTIEGDVGIMCACMPFFPALIKNSPAVQKLLVSVRSWVTKSKWADGTPSTTQSSHRKYLKAHGAEGDYLELGEAKVLAQPSQVQGPSTFRMEFEDYKS